MRIWIQNPGKKIIRLALQMKCCPAQKNPSTNLKKNYFQKDDQIPTLATKAKSLSAYFSECQ
jgi:hypothetical protein